MKILVAEDDADARTLLAEILNSAGAHYEVIVAEDGVKAWEALQANPGTALAIVDLGMPEIGGMEWLNRVRGDARFAKLPVIVCTGDSDRGTVAQAVARGVASYLVKPFTRSTVLDKVYKALRGSAPANGNGNGKLDTTAICERLGVDSDTYRLLAENHIRIVDSWTVDARRASRFPEVRALAVRAASIRETSRQLGAMTLADRLQDAETALAPFRTTPADKAALDACLQVAVSCGQTTHRELQRLRVSLDLV
jgi:two-component system chemotaxis response regulator CheY